VAKRTNELATVIITVSTIPDGARIERQWLQKSVWLSERFILRLLAVLLVFELIHRTISAIHTDLTATYHHNKNTLQTSPELITMYFISHIWRLVFWPAE